MPTHHANRRSLPTAGGLVRRWFEARHRVGVYVLAFAEGVAAVGAFDLEPELLVERHAISFRIARTRGLNFRALLAEGGAERLEVARVHCFR
jgi:hypothetical protein